MSTSTTIDGRQAGARKLDLKLLVGAGDKIGAFVGPFLVVGIALNVWRPALFAVGGPPAGLRLAALGVLAAGVVVWLSSVVLVLTRVPKHELITGGPFALVKHPLYTGVSLLVIPALGLLLNTWIGVVLGIVMYLAARRYAPAEERLLAEEFGDDWDAYERSVVIPWL